MGAACDAARPAPASAKAGSVVRADSKRLESKERPKPVPLRNNSEMEYDDDDYGDDWYEGEEEEADYYDEEEEDTEQPRRPPGSKGSRARVVSQYNQTIEVPILSPQ